MVLGQKVKFTYGKSDYVYSGVVEMVIPAEKHPLEYGFHVPADLKVRKSESYLVRSGSVVFWPENIRYL